LVVILAAGSMVYLVTRRVVGRPVRDLLHSFREVGLGDLHARVPVRHRDEFGRLAEEFNGMCRRLEAAQLSLIAEQEERSRMEARLRDNEHLASLGRLAAGLAHEIGTPLNVIGGRAEALLRRLTGRAPSEREPAERNLRVIVSQIDRIARIVRGMLDFARVRAAPRSSPTNLHALLGTVRDLLESRLQEAGISVEAMVPEDLPPVAADADRLHQVFLNIAMNAVDAMPSGGVLRVSGSSLLRSHPEEGGDARPFLALKFEDTGEGIRPEDLGRVLEPFFTTKEVGRAPGWGSRSPTASSGSIGDGWTSTAGRAEERA